MSPLISQLLVLGAVMYVLPYRIVVRPILLNRRAGRPTEWSAVRVLRGAFVVLLCGGGGWLSQIVHLAVIHGPTVWTIPRAVIAIALMLAGLLAGLISEHLHQDHADKAYTDKKIDHTHAAPAGADHTQDAL